jgi:hypothetical protein
VVFKDILLGVFKYEEVYQLQSGPLSWRIAQPSKPHPSHAISLHIEIIYLSHTYSLHLQGLELLDSLLKRRPLDLEIPQLAGLDLL